MWWIRGYGECSSQAAEPTDSDTTLSFLLLGIFCAEGEQVFLVLKNRRETQAPERKVSWLQSVGPAGCACLLPFQGGSGSSEGLEEGWRECSALAVLFWLFNQHLQLSVDILETKPSVPEKTKWALCLWAIRSIQSWSWTVVWTLDTYLPVRQSLCADLALGEVVMLENFDVGAPCMSFPYPCWEFQCYGDAAFIRQFRQWTWGLKENSAQWWGFPEGPICGGGRGGLELSIRTVLGTRTDHSVVFFKWAELQMSSDKKQWSAGFPQREVRLEKKETLKGVLHRKLKVKNKYYLLLFYGRTGVYVSKAESLRIKCLWDIKCNSGREWWGLWQMDHRCLWKGPPLPRSSPLLGGGKPSLNVFNLLKIVRKSQKFRYLYNFFTYVITIFKIMYQVNRLYVWIVFGRAKRNTTPL